MTGLTRISAALEDLGVLGAGQTVSGPDGALALVTLQRLFDAWAAESLIPYAFLRTTKALVSGTRDYTIGSGGDIPIVRPVDLIYAGFVVDSTATDPIETPIALISDQEWAELEDKTLDAASITGIHYDHAFSATERGTISTYPTVNVPNTQLVLYTYTAVIGYTTLAEDLEFPPGYDDAIHAELSRRLCRPFGRPVTPDLRDDADSAVTRIKLVNHRPVELRLDPGLPGMTSQRSAGRHFNQ